MHILGLHVVDFAIVVASLLSILGVGLYVSRGVEDENDFYVGGRKMGPLLQFFLNFGTMTDSNGAPTVATEVYRQGAAGLWIPFQPLFNTPFYWFSSIWWRRSRLITGSDQFVERFNSRRLAVAWAWWGVITVPLGVALGNIVSYKVAAAIFVKPESAYTAADRANIAEFKEYERLRAQFLAGRLPPERQSRLKVLESLSVTGNLPSYVSYLTPLPFYIGYTLMVMSYIMLGGIQAAAYTDAVQGMLIIVFSFLMIPIGLARIGGLAGLHRAVPEYMFRIFGSPAVSEYAWYSIGAFVLMGLVTIGTPASCGAGRDERAIRIGVLGGAFGKRIVMLAWMMCGLLAVAMFPGGISDPDNTWGVLSQSLLKPGLLGLMISGILLGHMPSVGNSAVTFAAMFARNLYEPMFPGRPEKHYLRVGKLSIAGSLAAGVLGAMFFSGIISLFTMMVSIGAFFGAVGLLMLFWRRLTAEAVAWGWIVWMLLLIALPWGLPRSSTFRRLPSLLLRTPQRTIDVLGPATTEDVAAGLAKKAGQEIHKNHVVPAASVFFESIALVDAKDPFSGVQGIGRFHLENYLLYRVGVPMERFGVAELNACRWLFDSIGPFIVLMTFSYIIPRRKRAAPALALARAGEAAAVAAAIEPWEGNAVKGIISADATPDPATYANIIMQGNINLLYQEHETAEQEQVRLERFYAKLKTPVGATPQEDELRLAETFAAPQRYDNLKLFPGSNWEFTKWTKTDAVGFLGCWAAVLAVLGILWAVLTAGS